MRFIQHLFDIFYMSSGWFQARVISRGRLFGGYGSANSEFMFKCRDDICYNCETLGSFFFSFVLILASISDMAGGSVRL